MRSINRAANKCLIKDQKISVLCRTIRLNAIIIRTAKNGGGERGGGQGARENLRRRKNEGRRGRGKNLRGFYRTANFIHYVFAVLLFFQIFIVSSNENQFLCEFSLT